MALIRNALLIGIAVTLLPTDRQAQQRFYAQAGDAAEWTRTFCDRNGDTCAKGAQAWATFVDKAQFGAKVGWDLIQSRLADQQGGWEPAVQLERTAGASRNSAPRPAALRGTLNSDDLAPRWRGSTVARRG